MEKIGCISKGVDYMSLLIVDTFVIDVFIYTHALKKYIPDVKCLMVVMSWGWLTQSAHFYFSILISLSNTDVNSRKSHQQKLEQ